MRRRDLYLAVLAAVVTAHILDATVGIVVQNMLAMRRLHHIVARAMNEALGEHNHARSRTRRATTPAATRAS